MANLCIRFYLIYPLKISSYQSLTRVNDEGQDIPVEEIHSNFKAQYGLDKAEGVFEAESEYDVGRTLAKDFLDRSGLNTDSLPQVLMNGVPMEEKNLNGEDFEEALMMSIMKETTVVQKAIYRYDINYLLKAEIHYDV